VTSYIDITNTSHVKAERFIICHQVARAIKFCTVAPYICGPSVWRLLYVTLQAPRISGWLLHFWKLCAPLT